MSLDSMFRFVPSPCLLPPDAQHVSAIFHPDLWSAVPPEEADACRSALGHAVPRRRSEFIAGRRCAVQALRCCPGQMAPDVCVVGRRRDRSPLWPSGVVGSITHTNSYAAAAVSRTLRGIGIDSERLLGAEEIDEIAGTIGSDDEIKRAVSAFACDRLGITVLFSVKESLFKCLYPIVCTWFDFRRARLAEADAETGVAVLELVAALDSEFDVGWRGVGSVRLDLPYVHTGFVLHGKLAARHAGIG